MRERIVAGLFALAAAAFAGLHPSGAALAQNNTGAPKFLYGHDVLVRPGGVKDFNEKTTRKVGIEVFQDEGTKAIVAISEAGDLAVLKAGPTGAERTCKWLTAHDLAVRKAGEPEFTEKTKKWGVELFQDLASNRLLYAAESAAIAFAPIPGSLVKDRGPKWHHALEPKVRRPGENSFENARKFGLEVFKDENTGGLIYISEVGSIAAAPAPATAPDPKKIAPPKTAYGLELRVRAADEPNFTDSTRRIGLEVFEDPNANALLYITDTGHIATAPKPAKLPDVRGVTWKGAMALKARKGGVKEFDKAKKYGIEVFQDNRTGNLIFISETGSIAVLPK